MKKALNGIWRGLNFSWITEHLTWYWARGDWAAVFTFAALGAIHAFTLAVLFLVILGVL